MDTAVKFPRRDRLSAVKAPAVDFLIHGAAGDILVFLNRRGDQSSAFQLPTWKLLPRRSAAIQACGAGLTQAQESLEIEEQLSIWAGRLLAGTGPVAAVPACDPETVDAFLHRHGIGPWLRHRLGEAPGTGIPPPAADPKRAVAVELARSREFARVMRQCRDRLKEPPVVYKGQALAHALYPQPWLRPRGDVDVLVEKSRVSDVAGVMTMLGYDKVPDTGSDLVMPQIAWRRSCAGLEHTWDVHWAISNRPALSGFLTYRELIANAVEVRVNDAPFMAPGTVDSLLIACLHLVGHHRHDLRLIWLYDIHLLIETASESERERFVDRARSRPAVRSACREALSLTCRYLATPSSRELHRLLDNGGDHAAGTDRLYLHRIVDDVRALRGLDRARFICQHLFPSRQYMMQRFGLRYRWQLPLWYAIRIGRAVPKLFRRR